MQIEQERGYLILAQNNTDTDYVLCAKSLAKNIKRLDKDASVCLLTDDLNNSDPIFDYVKLFPFGDQAKSLEWKLQNDWQCFYASPFRQTIKLEADLYLPHDISHWFDILNKKDLVVTIGCRNYLNQSSSVRTYRRVFDENQLPDVYNAITYWRLSKEAQEFFDQVRHIFDHWSTYMSAIKFGVDQPLNTDLAYALALQLLGPEKYIMPGTVPGLIHMKPAIVGLQGHDWTKELIWEFDHQSFRINTIQQMWPVHYHVKGFAREIEKHYG